MSLNLRPARGFNHVKIAQCLVISIVYLLESFAQEFANRDKFYDLVMSTTLPVSVPNIVFLYIMKIVARSSIPICRLR